MTTTPRKPRADSLRNRERLMEAAKAAFTEVGPEVSLEEIARRAGVGIGTLYRHFPAREALVEAVYRREVEQLAEAAGRLAAEAAPLDALRRWMRLFVGYLATKKVIAPALSAQPGRMSEIYAASGGPITEASARLLERARTAGDVRPDVEPADLYRALIGIAYGAGEPGWADSAERLVDILVDGLKTGPAPGASSAPGA